jgi:hypothetical protein
MSDQNSASSMILSNISDLSWDQLESLSPRTRGDILCFSPIRTIVRREEEIVLIRRVRKVEEVDASPACPINTTQMAQVQQGDQLVYEEVKTEGTGY